MKATVGLFITVLISAAYIPEKDCARILGIFQLNSKSHFIISEALMKGLAARGHQVVVMSHFPQKSPVPKYTDIDISGSAPPLQDNVTIENALRMEAKYVLNFIWEDSIAQCRDTMKHPKAQALLKSEESFDLVVTEICGSECTIGFAHRFKAPLVHLVTSVAFPWTHARIGNPDHPAYVPSYFLPYTSRMNFWQRLTNTVYNVLIKAGNDFYGNRPTSAVMREFFGEDVPSVEELASNASLVLVNSHFSVTGPRPAVPAFIEVGGIQIQEPKKLPQDLEKFLDESEHGVVYFNMGTLVRVQSLPPEKLGALLEAFAALPERVLMKFTGEHLPGKPANLLTSKWVPQIDVLSHPKTKLFISHGGLGGTQETVYAGVPVVGIPLFADQEGNINHLLELGMATKLNYEDITKESLVNAIRRVIDNSSYTESARRASAVFRDRPMSALDTAVYWVEYVARHRGAPHIRSAAADMPLHQYLLLDVAAFLLLVACAACCALNTALRKLVSVCSATTTRKHKRQ